jgi:hypothetical protein
MGCCDLGVPGPPQDVRPPFRVGSVGVPEVVKPPSADQRSVPTLKPPSAEEDSLEPSGKSNKDTDLGEPARWNLTRLS